MTGLFFTTATATDEGQMKDDRFFCDYSLR